MKKNPMKPKSPKSSMIKMIGSKKNPTLTNEISKPSGSATLKIGSPSIRSSASALDKPKRVLNMRMASPIRPATAGKKLVKLPSRKK